MKKLFFGMAMAFVAMAFTSCGDMKGCYEITQKIGDSELTGYYYGTKDDADLMVANLKKAAEIQAAITGVEVKVTKRKVSKSESDCVGGSLKL